MIDRLPSFDEQKLSGIEDNAVRWVKSGDPAQRAQAEQMLLAITSERLRRKQQKSAEAEARAQNVRERVRDQGLLARVILAFTEMVPEHWEVEVLKEIAARPGQDGTSIAVAIGKSSVGYINLAVGTLCASREPYLGLAPTVDKWGGKRFSELLIDFERHRGSDGSQWQSWTLKPEAYAGLRQLEIVG